jgi:hypothetical protein
MRLGSPNAIAAGVSNCSSCWERGLSQHREIDMFKPVNVVSLVGRQGEMRSTMPWTNSKPESKNSIAREAAARAVRELFRVCELPDTSNPEAFLAAAIGITARFPAETYAPAFEPINGLPSRMRRHALADIRMVLV